MRIPTRFLALFAVPAFASCSTSPCDSNPNGPSCLGTCTGQCAPDAPGLAWFMVYLWSAPDGTPPPDCPGATSGGGGLLGYLDTPPDVTSCSPSCECSPSSGACFQPSTVAANGVSCPPSGSGATFTLPDAWSGACATNSAAPSARSVSVAQPGLSTSDNGVFGCQPSQTTKPTFAGGKTRAMRCTTLNLHPEGECPLATHNLCAWANVDGFSVCLLNQGDIACPSAWPVKHLYFDDEQACQCNCGPATGDSCSTTVTLFEDGACTNPIGAASVSSDQPAACVDVATGSKLGSVSAAPPTYHAGMCAPQTTKSPVTTLCCLE
jgi:hypothetical protein